MGPGGANRTASASRSTGPIANIARGTGKSEAQAREEQPAQERLVGLERRAEVVEGLETEPPRLLEAVLVPQDERLVEIDQRHPGSVAFIRERIACPREQRESLFRSALLAAGDTRPVMNRGAAMIVENWKEFGVDATLDVRDNASRSRLALLGEFDAEFGWTIETWKTHFGQEFFESWGELNEPSMKAIFTGLFFWLACLWMYRQKIFIRI